MAGEIFVSWHLFIISSLKGHSYLKLVFGTIFCNLKNVKNTHGWMLLLVKLQVSFTKSNTPLWVFLAFLTLYKWYQIVQCITWKLTTNNKVILDTVLNTPKVINPVLTTQTKTWICQHFLKRQLTTYKKHNELMKALSCSGNESVSWRKGTLLLQWRMTLHCNSYDTSKSVSNIQMLLDCYMFTLLTCLIGILMSGIWQTRLNTMLTQTNR